MRASVLPWTTLTGLTPNAMDLVVQLCTRIGMIMEDMSPLAIDTSSDGMKGRLLKLFAQLGGWPCSSTRWRRC